MFLVSFLFLQRGELLYFSISSKATFKKEEDGEICQLAWTWWHINVH
jgi:hypothetical protein